MALVSLGFSAFFATSCGDDSGNHGAKGPPGSGRAFPPIKEAPVDFVTIPEEESVYVSTKSLSGYSERRMSVATKKSTDEAEVATIVAAAHQPNTLTFEDRVRVKKEPKVAAEKAAEMLETLADQMQENLRSATDPEVARDVRDSLEELAQHRRIIFELTRDIDTSDEEIATILSDAEKLVDEAAKDISDHPIYGFLLRTAAQRLQKKEK